MQQRTVGRFRHAARAWNQAADPEKKEDRPDVSAMLALTFSHDLLCSRPQSLQRTPETLLMNLAQSQSGKRGWG